METQNQNQKQNARTNDNIIRVGKKGIMPYAWAVMMQLKNNKETSLQARGKNISTAVDVAQVSINKLDSAIKIKSISIGTEEVIDKENRPLKISTIEIKLAR